MLVNREAQNESSRDVDSLLIRTLQRMKHWREESSDLSDLSLTFVDS